MTGRTANIVGDSFSDAVEGDRIQVSRNYMFRRDGVYQRNTMFVLVSNLNIYRCHIDWLHAGLNSASRTRRG